MTAAGLAGSDEDRPRDCLEAGRVQALGEVVLRTDRLEMRPLTPAYLEDMLALYQDQRVTEFLAHQDEAGHLRRLGEAERMWTRLGLGRVAIHERRTGRFIGRGGLHLWEQFGEVEVGWVLRADAWGLGYATESARAWVEWGLAHLDVPYLTAYVAPGNQASRAVAGRLGMSMLRSDTFHGRHVIVYALHRGEPGRGFKASSSSPVDTEVVDVHPPLRSTVQSLRLPDRTTGRSVSTSERGTP